MSRAQGTGRFARDRTRARDPLCPASTPAEGPLAGPRATAGIGAQLAVGRHQFAYQIPGVAHVGFKDI